MEQVKELILWARENRVQITRLKAGDVELELADLQLHDEYAARARKQAKENEWSPPTPPSKENIYAQLAADVGIAAPGRDRVEEEPT